MKIQTTSGVVVVEQSRQPVNFDGAGIPVSVGIFTVVVIMYIVNLVTKKKKIDI